MTEILIKRLSNNIELPTYDTSGSSGMNLAAYIERQINLEPGKTSVVPTGSSISIPKDYEIQIRPRSGLSTKNQFSVLNTPGTIDADYRDKNKIILINLGDTNLIIEKRDQVVQMVLCPIIKAKIKKVKDLEKTERDVGGFGSTGIY